LDLIYTIYTVLPILYILNFGKSIEIFEFVGIVENVEIYSNIGRDTPGLKYKREKEK